MIGEGADLGHGDREAFRPLIIPEVIYPNSKGNVGFLVYNIWESPEACQALGEVLIAIIVKVGFAPWFRAIMPIQPLEKEARS